MKLVKMLLTPPIAAISAVLALSASAEDWYVSDDMTYGEGIVSAGHRTNDLDAACAKAESGTIWVKDGFICQSGGGRNLDGAVRICIARGVTVRSESGYVDEANGKGATIRGELDMEAGESKYYLGDKSMRCVGFATLGGNSRLIGFVLENGSCNKQSDNAYGGGGVYGGARSHVVSNCVIRNCYAQRGGGAAHLTVIASVITNCTAKVAGGGTLDVTLRDSLVADCSSHNSSFGGGGAYSGSVSNCVFRGNYSVNYGTICNASKVIDSVVTNNTATGWGGGVSLCTLTFGTAPSKMVIADNKAGRGGGVYNGVCSNAFVHSNKAANDSGGGFYRPSGVFGCIISNNVAGSHGGGIYEDDYKAEIRDSVIVANKMTSTSENKGGAGVYGCKRLVHCILKDNISSRDGGGCSVTTIATNCVFIGNIANFGSGGGAKSTKAYDCKFIGNWSDRAGSAASYSGGGALYSGYAEHCSFVGNFVTNGCWGGAVRESKLYACALTNNYSYSGRGGALYDCSTTNCLVIANGCCPNGRMTDRGGGSTGGWHYNTLFAYNTASGAGGGAYEGRFVNCTFTGNTNASARAGIESGALAVNVVSWGNVGGYDSVTTASNSCLQVKTLAASYIDCVNVDPRLDAEFRPHARACKHTGLFFDWMTDEVDVRSKDLAGNPRIVDGAERPNMGCYESLPIGLLLLVK